MVQMRELDRKILFQLLRDGRQPISEIAKRVGASRQTVAKKIAQLVDAGVINSFTTKLIPESFGLNTKAYVFLHESPQAELRRKNEEFIKNLPRVTRFYRLFGEYDSILEIWAKDGKELGKLVKRIHRLKGVKGTETFIAHTAIKDNPQSPFLELLKPTSPPP
jgi:Lrp/AsnC family leucine-responsive transcriptional regulator